MKEIFRKALKDGTKVKQNHFETAKGMFCIECYEYLGGAYFFKYKNGKLVECKEIVNNARYLVLNNFFKNNLRNIERALCKIQVPIQNICIYCNMYRIYKSKETICQKCRYFKYCPTNENRKD